MGFPNSVFGGGGGGTGGGGGGSTTIVEGVIDLTPNPTSLYLLDESNLLALTEMTPKYQNVYSIDLDGGVWATADKLQVATQPAFDFDYTDAFFSFRLVQNNRYRLARNNRKSIYLDHLDSYQRLGHRLVRGATTVLDE